MEVMMGGIFGSLLGDIETMFKSTRLPPMVEETDVFGQEQYRKQLLQSRGGRRSTILGSRTASGPAMGSKTVLG
jgi:hypothetical protein